jgi:hypothetical protein
MIELLTSLFKSVAPKLLNQYIEHRFGKDIFIDKVKISKTENDILFDITTSSSSEQDIILVQLTILFLEKHQGINGAPEISNEYPNNDSSDFSIQKTENAIIVKFDLLEKQISKSTNRFTYKWSTNENCALYNKVEYFITYSIRGKQKDTKKTPIANPLFKKFEISGSN